MAPTNGSVSHKDLIEASKALRDGLLERMDSKVRRDLVETTQAIRDGLSERLDKRLVEIDEKLEQILVEVRQEIADLKDHYESGLDRMARLLKALPIPSVSVNVPEGKAPQVILPKDSIRIDVGQAP